MSFEKETNISLGKQSIHSSILYALAYFFKVHVQLQFGVKFMLLMVSGHHLVIALSLSLIYGEQIEVLGLPTEIALILFI